MSKPKKTCSKGHSLLKGAVICIRCLKNEREEKK